MLSFSFSRKREKVSREGATDEGNGVQEIATPSPDPAKSPSLATGVFTDALWPGHPLPQCGRGESLRIYVLNLKCITSPSATTYSLPSSLKRPASRAPASPLFET